MANQVSSPGGPPVDERSERIFRDIEQSGALPGELRAPEAAGAVLCVLSARVSGGEARDLAAALPSTLQAIVQPCAAHREEPGEVFGQREFLATLSEHLRISEAEAEAVAREVFKAVQRQMPPDEITDVESQLPVDLKTIWGRRRAAA